MRWRRGAWLCILAIVGCVAAGGVSHRASSAGAGQREFRFVVLGDNRPGIRTERLPFVYHLLLKEVMARRPVAVFNTGDIIIGGTDDSLTLRRMFEEFRRTSSILTVPLHVAPGNHDYFNRTSRALFQELIGPPYFSVDYGGCHFVVLSSECEGEVSRIIGKQLAWLQDDLVRHRGSEHLFVVVHRPFFPVGPHKGDSFDAYAANRDSVLALLVAHGAEILFAGHEHLYHDATYGRIRQIITGGGGAPLYAPPDSGGIFHFVLVKVSGKNVQTEVVRVEDPYEKAVRALEGNDARQALQLMQRVLQDSPDQAEAHLYLAVAHFRLGDRASGGQELAIFLEQEQRTVAAYEHAGKTLTTLGLWPEAFALFREFANDKPESPLPYLGLGQCFFRFSSPDSAALCLERAATLDSLAARVRYWAGEIYEKGGRLPDAIRHYRAAVRLNPSSSYGKRAAERLREVLEHE
ncbi:MAG: tetratricopeptide repeat protein [candidate division KSB1 bacterium]|nr:tetratricopeptide repeat protein [candidate division KSB1 bacterium]